MTCCVTNFAAFAKPSGDFHVPHFAANLTMLWPDLPVLERFRAAAEAGFRRVEILFVHDLDADAVAKALTDHKLHLILFDPRPGDFAKGERGLLSLPGREAEFLASIVEAIAAAQRFGTPRINALCGIPPPGTPHSAAVDTAVHNLRAAAPLIEKAGLELLVEAINRVDMPGYFAGRADEAAALVEASGSASVGLQLDQYHVAMAGEDARAALKRHKQIVKHVQIADVPGRNQPGTGAQPIAAFLADLDASSYRGQVGLEYRPRGSMEEALEWLPRSARR